MTASLLIHLRVPIVAPLAPGRPSGGSSTPGIYCGRSGIPIGLSALRLKDVEAAAGKLGAEVCPSCLKTKSDKDRSS